MSIVALNILPFSRIIYPKGLFNGEIHMNDKRVQTR